MGSLPWTHCYSMLRPSLIPLQQGKHHDLEEYRVRNQEPKSEVQIYTWADATLRELTDLVKEVILFPRSSVVGLKDISVS